MPPPLSLLGSVGRQGKNLPADVRLIQELLNQHRRPPMALLPTSGIAEPNTIRAIEDFQQRVVKLSRPDGRIDVGGLTFKALVAQSKPVGWSSPFLGSAPFWTPPPSTPLSPAPSHDPSWFPTKTRSSKGEKWTRETFGDFDYSPKPATTAKQPIKILDGWESKNIITVDLPQINGVATYGGTMKGTVRFHKLAAKQLQRLWAEWESRGLMKYVKFWDGGFYPRYQASSTTKLSNHSWGTAFDINATWNGWGKQPAAMGQTGCLLPLVPIAEKHGFAWGGFFSSKDGMHFEVAELK